MNDDTLQMRELIVLGTAAITTSRVILQFRDGGRGRDATASKKSQRLDQFLAVSELVACLIFVVAFSI